MPRQHSSLTPLIVLPDRMRVSPSVLCSGDNGHINAVVFAAFPADSLPVPIITAKYELDSNW